MRFLTKTIGRLSKWLRPGHNDQADTVELPREEISAEEWNNLYDNFQTLFEKTAEFKNEVDKLRTDFKSSIPAMVEELPRPIAVCSEDAAGRFEMAGEDVIDVFIMLNDLANVLEYERDILGQLRESDDNDNAGDAADDNAGGDNAGDRHGHNASNRRGHNASDRRAHNTADLAAALPPVVTALNQVRSVFANILEIFVEIYERYVVSGNNFLTLSRRYPGLRRLVIGTKDEFNVLLLLFVKASGLHKRGPAFENTLLDAARRYFHVNESERGFSSFWEFIFDAKRLEARLLDVGRIVCQEGVDKGVDDEKGRPINPVNQTIPVNQTVPVNPIIAPVLPIPSLTPTTSQLVDTNILHGATAIFLYKIGRVLIESNATASDPYLPADVLESLRAMSEKYEAEITLEMSKAYGSMLEKAEKMKFSLFQLLIYLFETFKKPNCEKTRARLNEEMRGLAGEVRKLLKH